MGAATRRAPARRWAIGVVALGLVAAASSRISAQAAGPPEVVRSQVTTDPKVAAGEAWVVTDPLRPERVAVIWLSTRDSSSPDNFATPGYCGVGVSEDGGLTWRRQHLPFAELTSPELPASDEVPICGDPVAGVGPDGTLYAAAANVGSPSLTQGVAADDTPEGAWPAWGPATEVFGGTQLLDAAQANPGHRTPAIAMGRASMAVDLVTGAVSVVSQEDGGVEGRWLAVSTDHGRTWSAPRPVDPDIQSRTAGAHSAAHGTIAIVYTVDTTSPQYLTSPSPAVTCPAGRTTCSVFATTGDNGTTWTRRVMPFAGVLPATFTFASQIVAADPSRPGRFAVLLATNAGANLEIWVTDDAGVTWRDPTVLTAAMGEQFTMPWIAYSPTGALGVVWRTPHANGTTDVRAIVAGDGSAGFSDEVPIATVPTNDSTLPGDDCACNLHLDRTTLSATWSDSSTGQRQIYFGRFDYTKLRPRGR